MKGSIPSAPSTPTSHRGAVNHQNSSNKSNSDIGNDFNSPNSGVIVIPSFNNNASAVNKAGSHRMLPRKGGHGSNVGNSGNTGSVGGGSGPSHGNLSEISPAVSFLLGEGALNQMCALLLAHSESLFGAASIANNTNANAGSSQAKSSHPDKLDGQRDSGNEVDTFKTSKEGNGIAANKKLDANNEVNEAFKAPRHERSATDVVPGSAPPTPDSPLDKLSNKTPATAPSSAPGNVPMIITGSGIENRAKNQPHAPKPKQHSQHPHPNQNPPSQPPGKQSRSPKPPKRIPANVSYVRKLGALYQKCKVAHDTIARAEEGGLLNDACFAVGKNATMGGIPGGGSNLSPHHLAPRAMTTGQPYLQSMPPPPPSLPIVSMRQRGSATSSMMASSGNSVGSVGSLSVSSSGMASSNANKEFRRKPSDGSTASNSKFQRTSSHDGGGTETTNSMAPPPAVLNFLKALNSGAPTSASKDDNTALDASSDSVMNEPSPSTNNDESDGSPSAASSGTTNDQPPPPPPLPTPAKSPQDLANIPSLPPNPPSTPPPIPTPPTSGRPTRKRNKPMSYAREYAHEYTNLIDVTTTSKSKSMSDEKISSSPPSPKHKRKKQENQPSSPSSPSDKKESEDTDSYNDDDEQTSSKPPPDSIHSPNSANNPTLPPTPERRSTRTSSRKSKTTKDEISSSFINRRIFDIGEAVLVNVKGSQYEGIVKNVDYASDQNDDKEEDIEEGRRSRRKTRQKVKKNESENKVTYEVEFDNGEIWNEIDPMDVVEMEDD